MEDILISVELKGKTVPEDPEISVEDFVTHLARISNPKNQFNHSSSRRLWRYLLRKKHYSPLEMVNLVVDITAPRDITRQILRHRSCAFQEFSQRYANPLEMGFLSREARLQDHTNRQNSIELAGTAESRWLASEWERRQKEVIDLVTEHYQWATKHGIAKESARVILPEGNMLSRMYVNGTLRSWLHYCYVRMAPDTQKEHRQVATACWEIVINVFPVLGEPEFHPQNAYNKELI
jgi:thymidylate synthase (FAD)